MNDHERFKNLTAGIQSLVISIAVVIGGVWTLYTFSKLGQASKAQAELAELEFKIKSQTAAERKVQAELAELEFKIKRQTAVEISLEACQHALPGDSSYYVSVIAVIKNVGSRNANLQYSNPLTILPVGFDANGKILFSKPILREITTAPPSGVVTWNLVRVGTTLKVPFFVPVPGPGLYFLHFGVNVGMDQIEQEVYREAGIENPRGAVWSGRKFFIVREGATCTHDT